MVEAVVTEHVLPRVPGSFPGALKGGEDVTAQTVLNFPF